MSEIGEDGAPGKRKARVNLVQATLDDATMAWVRERAAAEGRTVAAFIRRCIEQAKASSG